MRHIEKFNNGFLFAKHPIGTTYEEAMAAAHWQTVDIPHDWMIADAYNLYETGEGWYKKEFSLHKEDNVYEIYFEGIYMDSTIFLNNQKVGEWKYGYSSFAFDISDYLVDGTNQLVVKVVYECPNSRWYSGAGIYRDVYLRTLPKAHLVSDGVYIAPQKDKEHASAFYVDIQAEVSGMTSAKTYRVCHYIKELPAINCAITVDKLMGQEATNLYETKQTVYVENPQLWDITSPHCYTLVTNLYEDEVLLDTIEEPFGFRTLKFTKNDGFYLNDTYVKLHGCCQHHDLGALGAATNEVALRRQFKLLMEMGVNSIRTSHNMPSKTFMRLADEMGLLIVSEAFDMWEGAKTPYDYARFFPKWHEKDVAAWVRRDRNHPSLIMWSIGNEIYDTHHGARGKEVAIILRDLVLKHDPKWNAWVTFGSNYMPWENTQDAAKEIPIVGYNYGEYLYDAHHETYPDWIIYGSETASTVQSRGVYHFPASQSMLANDDEQCSSLGNCTTSWGAKSTFACIIDDRDRKYCLGQYIWTGFDYIGEPTPYSTKNSYFGQIDTAGFKKDSFYAYKGEWTSYKDDPFVHILPYWDFNEGQLVNVRLYSNAPKVALYFNGEKVGEKTIDHTAGEELFGDFLVHYEKGELVALAYDENDVEIASDKQSSFGDPVKICATLDKEVMLANGVDIVFVEIGVEDGDGHMVSNANNRMFVEVSGVGRLVGLDNGSSTDYDSYKGLSKRLFNGKLLAMIQSNFEAGDIVITITSNELVSKELTLSVIETEVETGVSDYLIANSKQAYEVQNADEEIPVRKVELSATSQIISKEHSRIEVNYKALPLNTTYSPKDFTWRIINDAGIDTHEATFEVLEDRVVVIGKGDGKFRLRCIAKNGRPRAEVMSDLEFEVQGFGKLDINPYEFVTGGLYTRGIGDLGNGNERGVSTARDTMSFVGFENLNFGDYGSDEITIPFFHNSHDPLHFEIWQGIPNEGGELLSTESYHLTPIWNTYQPATYRLPKRLKGIQTIGFKMESKVHIKGFSFTKYEKAFSKLEATENDSIVGDSFVVCEDSIKEIGNNVTITYTGMDFKEKGFSKIKICGHSGIPVSTIHIRCNNGEDHNQAIEFINQTDGEFEEQLFDLEGVTGLCKVCFVFLPGSNFNLKSIQFIEG